MLGGTAGPYSSYGGAACGGGGAGPFATQGGGAPPFPGLSAMPPGSAAGYPAPRGFNGAPAPSSASCGAPPRSVPHAGAPQQPPAPFAPHSARGSSQALREGPPPPSAAFLPPPSGAFPGDAFGDSPVSSDGPGPVEALWPYIRGAIEQDVLKRGLEPKLSATVPGLRFTSLSLGDKPPHMRFVRVSEGPHPQCQTIVFDVGYRPGSSISISLGLGPLHAALCELTFRGRLCVCLVGLTLRLPIISGIKIFFASVPELTFSFSGIASALPLPPEKLQGLVKQVIAEKMVLPHSLNIHLDTIVHAFERPDFLAYHLLHSQPPIGALHVAVYSIEGCSTPQALLDAFADSRTSPAEAGRLPSSEPAVYAMLRLGSEHQQTESVGAGCKQRLGLSWPHNDLGFVVDSVADQELQVELHLQDRDSVLVQCDKMLACGSVPVSQLASVFGRGNGPLHRVALRFPGPAQDHGVRMCAVLSGSFNYLSSAPKAWEPDGPTVWLLQVTIDCVIGLGMGCDGKKFAIRAELIPTGGPKAGSATSSPKIAGKSQVAKSRFLNAKLDGLRFAEVKSRIKFLMDRGAKMTPEEVSWLLPGLVTPEAASKLMDEIIAEGRGVPDDAETVDVLIEQQLRLEVIDPHRQGLRVQLLDTSRNWAPVGVLEWSSLKWLAESPGLEDEMQAYNLDGSQAIAKLGAKVGGGSYEQAQVFLRRKLQHFVAPSKGGWGHRGRAPPNGAAFPGVGPRKG